MINGSVQHVIDVYEFDWNSIRNHSDFQVDATQALCLTNYNADSGKSYVLAGTRQGCIDIYDTKQWTIFKSHKLSTGSPIMHILCHASQVAGGQSPSGRRNSLPSALMQKGRSLILVATQEAKIYWINGNSLLEDANLEWHNIPLISKSGKILKIIISNENIYFLSKYYLFLFIQKPNTFERSNFRAISDEKYINIQVAIQVFALQETKRQIGRDRVALHCWLNCFNLDILHRRTFDKLQTISLDQMSSATRHLTNNPTFPDSITSILAVKAASIWIGTAKGVLIIFHDQIKLNKAYVQKYQYRPFYGPITSIETCNSSGLGRQGSYVMVTGVRYIPPEAQFSFFNEFCIESEVKSDIGGKKQCALIFDADYLNN